jgi:Uma2 family endonuclease
VTEAARQRYTFDEYIELEAASPSVKHEFLDGAVWAMAGGTPDHAAIAANVIGLLRERLRGQRCRVFTSDLRIRVEATGLGTYPDASVVCNQVELDPEDKRGHTVVNPTLVVEVLSPSTENYDRGEKREHYQRIPTVREIVLVAHDTRRVELWRRDGDAWSEHVVSEGAVELTSLDCSLPLEEIYLDPLAPSA